MKGVGGGGRVDDHVIYFLSHMGRRIEHPHLIRVRRSLNTNNGVYLRDVKRWLAELRGQQMPDAFSWSYKRKYRSGYIWQDLVDDDLITPISDNEYVLKGSQISTSTLIASTSTSTCKEKEQQYETPKQVTCQISSPGFGSERSTLTEDDLYPPNPNKKEQDSSSFNWSFSSSTKSGMRKTRSHRITSIRNLMPCRAEDANEQVIVMCNPNTNTKQPLHLAKPNPKPHPEPDPHPTTRTLPDQTKSQFPSSKSKHAAYKPVGRPTCSQCGKLFKPEKMHTHMKSCKGMKASA